MDKALQLTDKKLEALESKVGRVYKNDPALKQIKKEFNAYMKMVQKRIRSSYEAYINENDKNTKEELKRVYMDELRDLTLNSVKYRKLIKKFTKVMADVNQKALDLVNAEMSEIYVINYNQIATDCKKIGIKVNG
jgi:hypothetical protein